MPHSACRSDKERLELPVVPAAAEGCPSIGPSLLLVLLAAARAAVFLPVLQHRVARHHRAVSGSAAVAWIGLGAGSGSGLGLAKRLALGLALGLG